MGFPGTVETKVVRRSGTEREVIWGLHEVNKATTQSRTVEMGDLGVMALPFGYHTSQACVIDTSCKGLAEVARPYAWARRFAQLA